MNKGRVDPRSASPNQPLRGKAVDQGLDLGYKNASDLMAEFCGSDQLQTCHHRSLDQEKNSVPSFKVTRFELQAIRSESFVNSFSLNHHQSSDLQGDVTSEVKFQNPRSQQLPYTLDQVSFPYSREHHHDIDKQWSGRTKLGYFRKSDALVGNLQVEMMHQLKVESLHLTTSPKENPVTTQPTLALQPQQEWVKGEDPVFVAAVDEEEEEVIMPNHHFHMFSSMKHHHNLRSEESILKKAYPNHQHQESSNLPSRIAPPNIPISTTKFRSRSKFVKSSNGYKSRRSKVPNRSVTKHNWRQHIRECLEDENKSKVVQDDEDAYTNNEDEDAYYNDKVEYSIYDEEVNNPLSLGVVLSTLDNLKGNTLSIIDSGYGMTQAGPGGSFTMNQDVHDKLFGRGIKITLLLKDNQLEYLEERRIKDSVKKHSEFISYPIHLWTGKTSEKEISGNKDEEEEFMVTLSTQRPPPEPPPKPPPWPQSITKLFPHPIQEQTPLQHSTRILSKLHHLFPFVNFQRKKYSLPSQRFGCSLQATWKLSRQVNCYCHCPAKELAAAYRQPRRDEGRSIEQHQLQQWTTSEEQNRNVYSVAMCRTGGGCSSEWNCFSQSTVPISTHFQASHEKEIPNPTSESGQSRQIPTSKGQFSSMKRPSLVMEGSKILVVSMFKNGSEERKHSIETGGGGSPKSNL